MSRSYAFTYDQGMSRTVVSRQAKPSAHGRTAVAEGASNARGSTAVPALPERTVTVSIELTVTEAEALRDGAFTCTSPDPRRHHAGRRALRALRDALRATNI